MAQRVGRGIALLFHDRGIRRGWVVSGRSRLHSVHIKNIQIKGKLFCDTFSDLTTFSLFKLQASIRIINYASFCFVNKMSVHNHVSWNLWYSSSHQFSIMNTSIKTRLCFFSIMDIYFKYSVLILRSVTFWWQANNACRRNEHVSYLGSDGAMWSLLMILVTSASEGIIRINHVFQDINNAIFNVSLLWDKASYKQYITNLRVNIYLILYTYIHRSQRPRGLRHRSAAANLLT